MIGEWARDKMARYALLARGGEPIVWDFGSAARHHQLHAPWLRPENSRAGMLGLRGVGRADAGLFARGGARDQGSARGRRRGRPADRRRRRRAADGLRAAAARAWTCATASRCCWTPGEIKSPDEISLLATAAAMVDGTYQTIVDALKPGIRENEIVALANKRLYEMGSDDVEAINAVSGERCSPHPHNFTDRHDPPRRPGLLRHHPVVQRLPDLLLPHVRGRPGHGRAARRVHAGARVDRRGDRAGQARRGHRRDRPALAARDRTSASPTRWPRSGCSSATGSAWRCTSARSSAG